MVGCKRQFRLEVIKITTSNGFPTMVFTINHVNNSSLVCADVRLNISAQRSLATERKQWWGESGGEEPEVNNLVYTKRQKDIYANRKHKTTNCVPIS